MERDTLVEPENQRLEETKVTGGVEQQEEEIRGKRAPENMDLIIKRQGWLKGQGYHLDYLDVHQVSHTDH